MFMDLALSRRLEKTEGLLGTSFTEVNQRMRPDIGAVWRDFGGTYAIYDGAGSPMTQTFGLGLSGVVTPELLAEIETFFFERGADTMHEVSPLGGVEVAALLAERGYRPIDLTSILVQELAEIEAPRAAALHVRVAEHADRDAWIATSVHGWSTDPTYVDMMRAMATGAFANPTMVHFLVERDGAPIATASLGIVGDVALLAGASTVPEGRGLGAQTMLLAARLAEARRRGCAVAMMGTTPGSTSQRNAERRGFRIAYTRTKWRLQPSQATSAA